MRLAPESLFLGERARLPIRVGKRVTQEEIAEHLEISRTWYTRFESGAAAEFSIPLLNRLADILLLSAAERGELIRLAMPELAPIVRPDSTNAHDALSVVRRAVKRLWRATSEREILCVAGEEARLLVPCFELIFARRVVAREEAQFLRRGCTSAVRLAEARAYALRHATHEHAARVDALWRSTAEGGLLPINAYPAESLRLYRLVLHEHGVDFRAPVAAHIRGSRASAIVAGASTRPHDVSELDRAMLSTIADFASLALR